MINWLEIKLFQFVRWLIKRGYGRCEIRTEGGFMSEGRCAECDASDVQDWIDRHIDLIKF